MPVLVHYSLTLGWDLQGVQAEALRGDAIKDAVDIYDHIDLEELRADYLDKIPKLKPALLCIPADPDLVRPGRQTILESF